MAETGGQRVTALSRGARGSEWPDRAAGKRNRQNNSKIAGVLALSLSLSPFVLQSCTGWCTIISHSYGVMHRIRSAARRPLESPTTLVPSRPAVCCPPGVPGYYPKLNAAALMVARDGNEIESIYDSPCSSQSNATGAGIESGFLLSAGRNFAAGASAANELFLPTVRVSLMAVLPAVFLLTGVMPLVTYFFVSPLKGVKLSMRIAESVLWVERILYSAVAVPTVLLLSCLMNTFAAIVVVVLAYVVAQALIVRDVWNGTVELLTRIITLCQDRNMLSNVNTIDGSNSGTSADPLSSTGSLVAKEMESASGLFTVLVYMPIIEEVFFRGVLYGGCTHLLHRVWSRINKHKHESESSDKNDLTDESYIFPGGKILSHIDGYIALATSAIFSAVHIHNETGRLRGLLSAPEGTVSSMEFVLLVCLFTAMVAASVSATFVASLTITTPAYNSNGIWGSIGAHAMWNIRTLTVTFYLPLVLVQKFVSAIRTKIVPIRQGKDTRQQR